jgi:hypothetical protein
MRSWLIPHGLAVAILLQYTFLTVSFKSFRSSLSHSAVITNPPSVVILKAQSLDYTSLFLSVNELAKACVPGKVENVIQENEYNIFIGLKTADSENLWLQFCWHPSAARIGLGYAPPKGEVTPYSFSATLKAILRGCSVTSIKIPSPFDRIAEVEFSERLSDETPKWKLIVEVMGSRSNAILVSYGDNIIQACAYQVSSTTTVRPLQTGGVYQSPPSGGGKISPIELPVDKIKKKYYDKEIVPVENTQKNPYDIFAAGIKGMDGSIEKSLVTLYRLWLFIFGLFCYICIFYYLYVDSLTYAFGKSAFLFRIRFCDTLVVILFLSTHHHHHYYVGV